MEKRITMHVSGMTCSHCEKTLSNALKKLKGILSVSASFLQKKVEVVFESERITEEQIKGAIEEAGYRVKSIGFEGKGDPVSKVAPVFFILLGLYFFVRVTLGFDFFNLIPKIDKTLSLIALFATGLLTSVHCIAMCGGINLSQSVGSAEKTQSRFKRPLLYNLGRVISYTVIGGIVGGLGSVLFISNTLKGIIMLFAAVFMILMSLSMLGWLPHWLVPRIPARWSAKTAKATKNKGPLVVGLLNGFMPCGPLQAMQLYALSTGSIWMGALSMFLFSIGTLPLMLGTGILFSLLKGRFTRSITRVSAVLIMLIAAVMFVNATGFFGWSLNVTSIPKVANAQIINKSSDKSGTPGKTGEYTLAQIKDGVQEVTVDITSSYYPPIVVQKGIPVKFNLRAAKNNINGCNGTISIPLLNIQKELEPGDNIVTFTPEKSGNITYTCWMSMIRSTIVVVDDLGSISGSNGSEPSSSALPKSPTKSGGMPCCQ